MKNLFKSKTTREILAFSLLPFGISTVYSIVSTALNMYFTDVLGLSLSMTGIMLAVTKVWDAVNDPLMGMLVDKTNTRWGKCRPYVFWMSYLMILVTAMLFAPVDFGQTGNFIYAIIAYILYYTIYTALDIPNKALRRLYFRKISCASKRCPGAIYSARSVRFCRRCSSLRLPVFGGGKIRSRAISFLRCSLQRSALCPCSSPLSASRKNKDTA